MVMDLNLKETHYDLFLRFKKEILSWGENIKVIKLIKSYKFLFNQEEFVKVLISKKNNEFFIQSILITMLDKNKQLHDPKGLTIESNLRKGKTYSILPNDFYNFDYVIDLIKQAYESINNGDIKKSDNSKQLDIISEEKRNCKICGKELSVSSSKEICKECARKQYALKIIKKLLNIINPEVKFKKEDLILKGIEKIQTIDYIWTLQEFNLIDEYKSTNEYSLKKQSDLNDFIKEVSKDIDSVNEENDKQKLNKFCSVCNNNLTVSNFYKSENNEDGLSKYCKDCTKIINGVRYLKKLLKIVDYNDSFTKKKILNNYENPTQLQNQIWILEENNLLNYNKKTDEYNLVDKTIIDKFMDNYSIFLKDEKKELIIINSGENYKIIMLKGILTNENLFNLLILLKEFSKDVDEINTTSFKYDYHNVLIKIKSDVVESKKILEVLKNNQWEE
jgi:hypothetical protein